MFPKMCQHYSVQRDKRVRDPFHSFPDRGLVRPFLRVSAITMLEYPHAPLPEHGHYIGPVRAVGVYGHRIQYYGRLL